MGNRFVTRLFGARADVAPEIKDALAELTRLIEDQPALAGPGALLAELLPVLFARPVQEALSPLPEDHAAAKQAGGIAALRGEHIAVDAKSFRRRWLEICSIMAGRQKNGAAEAAAGALRTGNLDADELVRELLGGRPENISQRADEMGLDAGAVLGILRLTMFPVMVHLNRALAILRQSGSWQHGYCPTCGSWPLLGEFRGLEQVRFLRCGLCAAEWEFPRLLCPFCGVSDHSQLGYLHVEGEETKQRAATCETCRGYVKMLSTLAALSPPQLLVAEVATTHLDLIASERGYTAQP